MFCRSLKLRSQSTKRNIFRCVFLEGEGRQKEREGVEGGSESKGRREKNKLPLLISVPTHPHWSRKWCNSLQFCFYFFRKLAIDFASKNSSTWYIGECYNNRIHDIFFFLYCLFEKLALSRTSLLCEESAHFIFWLDTIHCFPVGDDRSPLCYSWKLANSYLMLLAKNPIRQVEKMLA